MKGRQSLHGKVVIAMGLFTLLSIIAIMPVAVADSINPGVFPISSKPYGLSYGEWTAKWWQWATQIPTSVNPIPDKTGASCAQNQSGPVWFLAGSSGAPIFRNCVIPAGKALLFGPINSECSTAEDSTLKTEAQLKSCAVNDDVGGIAQTTVDGVPMQSLQTIRFSHRYSTSRFRRIIFLEPVLALQSLYLTDGIL